MESVRVFAPATIANMGPGFDVIGMAVKGLGDVVEARRMEAGIRISVESETRLPTEPTLNTASIAASEVLKAIDADGGIDIKLKKGLPIGSGLGSSASSAAAGAFAANHLFGNRLSKEELILHATRAEEVVSGFHADNTAPCLLGGAILIRPSGKIDIVRIGSIDSLKIVLVTPEITILTKEARGILPEKIPMKDFVLNMANTSFIAAAFAKNDYSLLSNSINDIVIEPVRSKLIKGFDKVKESALNAGADGMSISGSGPSVFAITDDEDKAARIKEAMTGTFSEFDIDSEGIVTEVDSEGTRLETKDK